MVKPVAIFDLDSTLLEGDCEILWVKYLAKRGLVDEPYVKQVQIFAQEYLEGTLNYADFEYHLQIPLLHRSAAEGKELIDGFLAGIEEYFRPFMLEHVEDHRRQGYATILATAANSLLAQPIAKKLGMDTFICTWMEVIDGIPTGKIIGFPPFREGKVEKIKAWMAEQPVTLTESWAYSDSYNDMPILNLVEHPVAVTPDDNLRRAAQEKGWPILEKNS
jgi:HAD superfamily hydrolase (TIGR01490 family)